MPAHGVVELKMSKTVTILRHLIRESLNEADDASLSDYTLQVVGKDQIRVTKKTGQSGVTKNIEVMSSKWPTFLDIKSLSIPPGGFNPSAPEGQTILTIDVVVDHPVALMDDIVEKAEMKNRAALLAMADAIIRGVGYSAPKKVNPKDGSFVRLIVNGGDGSEKK